VDTVNLVDLSSENFRGFLFGGAVRLYHQNTGWYVGLLKTAKIESGKCLLRIDPFQRLVKTSLTCRSRPEDPGQVILVSADQIESPLRTDELPFQIKEPKLLKNEEQVLVIVANDRIEEIAVISKRPQDVKAVEKILGIK